MEQSSEPQQTPYIGSKISLVSRSQIRYEGILYTVDTKESTIALAKVKSFGTEDRKAETPVTGRDEIYEYIIFKASDIQDLMVCETPKPVPQLCHGLPYDPAIVSVSNQQPNAPTALSPSAPKMPSATENITHSPRVPQQPPPVHQRSSIDDQRKSEMMQQNVAPRSAPEQHPSPPGGANRSAGGQARGGFQDRPFGGFSSKQDNQNRGFNDRGATWGSRGPDATRGGGGGFNQHSVFRDGHRRDSERERNERGFRGGGVGGGNVFVNQNYYRDRQHGPHNQMRGGSGAPGFNRTVGTRGGVFGTFGAIGGPSARIQSYHYRDAQPQRRFYNQHRGADGGWSGGGGGFGGGRGFGRQHAPAPKFEGDYDFEQANDQFQEKISHLEEEMKAKAHIDEDKDKKDEEGDGAILPDSGVETAEEKRGGGGDSSTEETSSGDKEFYDKNHSFFDKISCELTEREARARGENPNPNYSWRKERMMNADTFGPLALRNFQNRRGGYMRGRGRGGGGGGYNRAEGGEDRRGGFRGGFRRGSGGQY